MLHPSVRCMVMKLCLLTRQPPASMAKVQLNTQLASTNVTHSLWTQLSHKVKPYRVVKKIIIRQTQGQY